VSSTADVVLQVSECLAWALPAPYGAIAAGGLTFVEAMFFTNDSASKVTKDVLQQALNTAVQNIEAYLESINLRNEQSAVKDFSDWLNRSQTLEPEVGDNIEYYKSVRDVVDKNVKPGYLTVFDVVERVADDADRATFSDPDQFANKQLLIDTLAAATTALMFAYRTRVLAAAKLADIYERQENREEFDAIVQAWAYYHADVVSQLHDDDGCVATFQRIVSGVRAQILADQSKSDVAPYPKDVTPPGLTSPGLEDLTAVHSYQECINYYGQFGSGQYAGAMGWCPLPYDAGPTWGGPFADQLPNGPYTGVLENWKKAGQTWYDNTPPKQPEAKPTVGAPWGGSIPKEPHWVAQNEVAYAYAYKNSKGVSPKSAYCDWVALVTQAFPTVTCPPDPLQQGTQLLLYRKFQLDGQEMLIKLLPVTDPTKPVEMQDTRI